MKRLILILAIIFGLSEIVYAADTEVQDLTDITSPASGDDMYIVDDPDGTPVSRKISVSALFGVATDLDAGGALSVNTVDSSELVNGSVDLAHMSSDSVNSDKIVDDSIVNADVSSSAAIAATKLESAVIVSTEIDTFSELDAIVADEDLVGTTTTFAGGDITGNIKAAVIVDDSHAHTVTTLTVNTADIADVSVIATELAELETIGTTTISANQWATLGGIAETLSSSELDLLDGITVLSGSNTGDNTVAETGDSATAFFSSGTIEHEYGGLETDTSSYDGLIGITGGATYNQTGTDGQIIIFDGSGAPTSAVLSSDATMTNAGVVTVVDDSHAHVIANIDNFSQVTDGWATGQDLIQWNNGSTNTYFINVQGTDTATNGQVPTFNTGGFIDWQDAVSSETNDLESAITGILDTEILIGTGTDTANYAAMSGDVTMANDGTTTIGADKVALTTDTTGNYAAGDAEAGNALTGDSATSFFSSGILEVAIGGTGTDTATGTGDMVKATSPTLITPALGVATATTINKVTLTSPATSATITATDGTTTTLSGGTHSGTNTGDQTVNTADIADVSVTQAELTQLETIGSTTISANQWSAVGGMPDTLDGTELGYIDGVTSAIQTQLDGKEGTLTDKASLESTISDVADFAEADGDTYTNAHNFSGGTLEIPNGSTVPGSPTKGDIFLHTPTGRNVLYIYDGSDWQSSAIESFGTMTLYVDTGTGSDSIDKGGATTTGAFNTLQYAIDTIPPVFNGNVIINLTGEDYAEDVVIQGKTAGGNYTIKLVGTMTEIVSETTNADVFSNTTVGDTSLSLTSSAHIGQVVRISGGSAIGQEAVILSNDTTTITIVGSWRYSYPNDTANSAPAAHLDAPDATSDFIVEDWATTIDSIEIGEGQKSVLLYHLKIDNAGGTNGSVYAHNNAACGIDVCKLDGDGVNRTAYIVDGSQVNIKSSLVLAGSTVSVWNLSVIFAICNVNNTWFDREGVNSAKSTVLYSGSQGNFLSSRVDDPDLDSDSMIVEGNSNILFGFNSHSGVFIDDHASNTTGNDLLINTGAGVRSAANANNTYNGTVGKTVTSATYGWEN